MQTDIRRPAFRGFTGRLRRITAGQIVLMAFMLLLALTMIVPVLNILAKSFSDPAQSRDMGGLRIIPAGFDMVNYRLVFSNKYIMPTLRNSIYITVVGTALNIFLTTSAAYVLIQPQLFFKKAIMTFLIIMMLFDPGIIPEYMVMGKRQLNLIGSQWSIILVYAVNVYYLIIMMRYFQEVPAELYEAARIDGAGHMTVLFRIVFPLAKAGIATITMFYAVVRWNEYFKAGIYLTKASETTLQVILRQFVVLGDTTALVGMGNMMSYNELAQIDYGALKAATIIVAIVPILILYPFVLRFYTRDVIAGSIKG
ncbi:MAG: carbohydrate ABC transporter permease [Bacillota bacterium]